MTDDDDDDNGEDVLEEDTKPDTPNRLSQQLVMTPQLQLAIRLLATPARELPAIIAEWRAAHPGARA